MKYRRAKDTPYSRREMIAALYGIKHPDGRMRYCAISNGEFKLCYATSDKAAKAAAAYLEASAETGKPQRPYRCEDAEDVHYHLTSRLGNHNRPKSAPRRRAQKKRAKARKRNAAIAAFQRWADPIRCGATREHRTA